MAVDLILLVIEVDHLARHEQYEALRTLASATGAPGGVQQLMGF